MDELIFEEPPAPPKGPDTGSAVRGWLAAVKQHPNTWVKYPDRVNPSTAMQVKRGGYGVKAGEFEAIARNIAGKPARCDLYVRYVGKVEG